MNQGNVIVGYEGEKLLVLTVILPDGRELGLDIDKPNVVNESKTSRTTARVWWHQHKPN